MTYEELEDKLNDRFRDTDIVVEYDIEFNKWIVCTVEPDEIDVSMYIQLVIDGTKIGIIDVDTYCNTDMLSRCIDLIVEFARTPIDERGAED